MSKTEKLKNVMLKLKNKNNLKLKDDQSLNDFMLISLG